jgi:hypothetical protein
MSRPCALAYVCKQGPDVAHWEPQRRRAGVRRRVEPWHARGPRRCVPPRGRCGGRHRRAQALQAGQGCGTLQFVFLLLFKSLKSTTTVKLTIRLQMITIAPINTLVVNVRPTARAEPAQGARGVPLCAVLAVLPRGRDPKAAGRGHRCDRCRLHEALADDRARAALWARRAHQPLHGRGVRTLWYISVFFSPNNTNHEN